MVKKSKGQTEVEGSGGGLFPAAEEHSIGKRYKGTDTDNEFT